ncbi:Cation channel sperm-associated protein 1 (CatSper1), partial [Durusdinium trenchii]
DLEARKTEEENAQLRSTLAQLKSKPPKATQFSTSDDEMTENPESDDNSPVSRSQVSPTKIRVPDESRMLEVTAQPSLGSRPYTSHIAKRDREHSQREATGVNLLMSLKLPGQVYDEGNFFPKEDSSDSEDHDLPPWDAELTKRPKRAVAVMDMKERMRQMFKSGQVKASVYYKDEGWCSRIAGHQNFETVVYGFIVANVIWLGIDAIVNQEDLLINAEAYVIAIENVFCIFFLSELMVRLGAYTSLIHAVKDPWIIVDSLLVLGMVLETWIFYMILQFAEVDFSLIDQSSLRLLRVLRVSRVARIVRILRALPELLILVKALGVATRSVFFTFCLLLLVIYLFALACTTIGKDTTSGDAFFKTLGQSMFTLFFNGLFGFDLPSIATVIFADNTMLAIVFCLYLVCAPLTMMNLLVAVLVEVVGVLAIAEQEMVQTQYEWDQMRIALSELGEDDNITIDQFKKLLDKREALMGMRALGIDVIAMLETPQLIFGETPSLTFAEFTEIILALRDSNTATVRDINTLAKRIISEIQGTVGQLNSKIKEKSNSKERGGIVKMGQKSERRIGR